MESPDDQEKKIRIIHLPGPFEKYTNENPGAFQYLWCIAKYMYDRKWVHRNEPKEYQIDGVTYRMQEPFGWKHLILLITCIVIAFICLGAFGLIPSSVAISFLVIIVLATLGFRKTPPPFLSVDEMNLKMDQGRYLEVVQNLFPEESEEQKLDMARQIRCRHRLQSIKKPSSEDSVEAPTIRRRRNSFSGEKDKMERGKEENVIEEEDFDYTSDPHYNDDFEFDFDGLPMVVTGGSSKDKSNDIDLKDFLASVRRFNQEAEREKREEEEEEEEEVIELKKEKKATKERKPKAGEGKEEGQEAGRKKEKDKSTESSKKGIQKKKMSKDE